MQEYAALVPSLNVSHVNFFDAEQVAPGKTQRIGSLVRQFSSLELQVQEGGYESYDKAV